MNDSLTNDSPALAAIYDRVSDAQLEAGKRLVERLGLRPGDRVLDVGCGTGRLTRWIGEIVMPGGKVVGVDPLAERVAIARANVGSSCVGFEVGQAEDLRAFDAEAFDAVCMSSVFHWIEDRRKALAEVRRVLRPGGRVGVTTIPAELMRTGIASSVIAAVLAHPRYAGLVDLSGFALVSRAATTTELIAFVSESHLELAELHVAPGVRIHGSGDEVVDFIEASSFGNFLRIVPEQVRAAFREDLVTEFNRHRTAEGQIKLRDWGVTFVAERSAR